MHKFCAIDHGFSDFLGTLGQKIHEFTLTWGSVEHGIEH